MPKEEYGSPDDVQIGLEGASFGESSEGHPRKTVIVSRADPSADAPTNQPVPIRSRINTATEFGQSSALAAHLQAATANEAPLIADGETLLYGVAPSSTSVTEEQIVGGSDTLENAPIIESASDIVVEHVTTDDSGNETAEEVDFNFTYETLSTAPTQGEAVNLNPRTGEVEAPTSDDYQISYPYLNWSAAIDAAASAIGVDEVGVIGVDAGTETVGQTLSAKLDEIRTPYRMAVGVTLGQPNATNANGEPIINAEQYEQVLDNSALFAITGGELRAKPTAGSTSPPRPMTSPIGGIAGQMASNGLTDSIWNDPVEGYDNYELVQSFDGTEIQTLREAGTIPLLGANDNATGKIQIQDNRSTSTATDWERDLHRRQLNDVVLLNVREVGHAAESEFQTDSELKEIKQSVLDRFSQLASDGVIMSAGAQNDSSSTVDSSGLSVSGSTPATAVGTPASQGSGNDSGEEDEEQYYTVEVERTALDEVTVRFAFVPTPIIKRVRGQGVVYDQPPQAISDSTTANLTGPSQVGETA